MKITIRIGGGYPGGFKNEGVGNPQGYIFKMLNIFYLNY